MKYALLTVALMFSGSALMAQEKSATIEKKQSTQTSVKDEIRVVAGTIKETLGTVSGLTMNAGKMAKVASEETKVDATALHEKLMKTQKDLETALTEVSNATPENWADVKAKAMATNTQALDLATELKDTLK